MMPEFQFNARDRAMLERLAATDPTRPSKKARRLFNYHLHPRGIKELANPKGIRVASLMGNLLDTLEEGQSSDRLKALHALRDEVFFGPSGGMGKNTARALLSVMKELLREENEQRRLELAHDFHEVLTGKPSIVRSHLKRYHLLEMPEAWNQLTFDHHVHDAHTKGRKSPTHLIMDAWIKGIRKLTVIYYDFIPPEAAEELLRAAGFMEIDVRIGLELLTEHRGKTVSLIWTPRGFSDANDFLQFLERSHVAQFMNQGRIHAQSRSDEVLSVLENFNLKGRLKLNAHYGIELPPLDTNEFKESVGAGQASMLHLSEFIHASVLPLLQTSNPNPIEDLDETEQENQSSSLSPEAQECIQEQHNPRESCTSEQIFEEYLRGTLPLSQKSEEKSPLPSPQKLIKTLETMHPGYRLTLNLTGLRAQKVLELLHVCKGKIHALEIYNHKDWARGLAEEVSHIRSFQHPLNEGNAISLKRAVMTLLDATSDPEDAEALRAVLHDLPTLLRAYANRPLMDRWGSDSTGRSSQLFGMGLAVINTLPRRAQKEVYQGNPSRILPIQIPVKLRKTTTPAFTKKLGTQELGMNEVPDGVEWIPRLYSSHGKGKNNVVSLGWRPTESTVPPSTRHQTKKSLTYQFQYLNTNVKNLFKVLIGFIPAFLTFFLTKDWWVLAYFGAPIWFGITGLRNILQSVIGGDGFRRSPLLTWNTYVNWSRVCDSLLYTGFSVPLLDFLVKQLLLAEGFGITTSTNVLALYGIMALVNGIYISSHNFLRGLPAAAIAGNFFRSILSIPLALAFNAALASILNLLGVPGGELILQKWAAVISKAASDSVAGIIEGSADWAKNIELRKRDYERKLKQLYSSFTNIELLLPETDVVALLKAPKKLSKAIRIENPGLLRSSIYDALDLLYFWYYQPHARTVLKRLVKSMPSDEKLLFLRFQHVLEQQKMICSMFLDGLLGKEFSKAMAFYLNRSKSYLESMDKLLKR
ncbi:MAG: hypothetical protein MI717_15325 [Spirochaetales bacterium]|nr:hypothetical protein [Spirochaetales bacterium]